MDELVSPQSCLCGNYNQNPVRSWQKRQAVHRSRELEYVLKTNSCGVMKEQPQTKE